ncbi:SpvB/TcaC N-terminal domain-containing protein [Marinicella sp. W31]|uniref:SpvB/TcaC N-terminal domain-containing protein n=1 Tax=Marinicella sp. W31 TaxID=3023713 RepID=UPI003756BA5F
MHSIILRIVGACALFLSFSLQAIDIPETERDRITQEVITELGRYDAAEIEKRSRLWMVEQPLPGASGELVEEGNCTSGCRLTETRGANLPEPRNVDIKAKKRKGKYSPNLQVNWKRPKSLPSDSPHQLSHYLVHVSDQNAEYKVYQIDAEFKDNGQPTNKQKINFRNLPDGDYLFQVQAIYEDTTTRKDSKGKDTPALQIFTRGSSKGGPVQNPALTVGHINQPETLRLYNCLLAEGHTDPIELDTIQTLDCSGWNLQDSDIRDTIDNNTTNSVDDRYDISDLTNLTYLDISNNPSLINLYDLYSLPSLSWLDVSYNTNLVFVWNLAAMDTFIATHMSFNIIPPDSVLPSDITYLDLSNNPITGNLNQLMNSQIATLKINDNTGSPNFTQLSGKNIETLELKNSSLVNMNDLSGINGLKYLTVDGSDLDSTIDIQSFSGFCGLSIKDTEVEEFQGKRPIQGLDLGNNTLMKSAQAYTGPSFYLPRYLSFSQTNALTCNHYYKALDNWNSMARVDMTQAYNVDMNGDGSVIAQSPICPAFAGIDTFVQPNFCKPNKPQDVKIYQDLASARRFVTWEVNNNHDHVRWGVTGFEIKAFDIFGNQIGTYFQSGQGKRKHTVNSIAAAYYTVSACTADTCGYETISSSVEQGLSEVQNLEVEWDTSDITALKYRLKFDYPQNAFDLEPYGRPDYFKITAGFTQPTGTAQSFTIPVSTVNGNSGSFWVSSYIDQDAYVGDSFLVQACNAELGCSASVETVIDMALLDLSLPVPQWAVNGVSVDPTEKTQITLQWDFNGANTNGIDYIEIEEEQPVLSASSKVTDSVELSPNTIKYYTDDISSPLELKRMTRGGYNFTLRACQRNRDTVDLCSAPSQPYNMSSADATVVRDDVYLGDLNNPAAGGLYNPEYAFFENPGQYQLWWEFHGFHNLQDYIKPDYFYFKSSGHTCELSNGQLATEFIMDVSFMFLEDRGNSLGKCTDFSGNSNWTIAACKYGAGCTAPAPVSTTKPSGATRSENLINTYAAPENRALGGPGEIHPGIYRHNDSPASGWYFYWNNSLQEGVSDPIFGETYDLVAYWFTHEEVNGDWTPVWYQSLLKRVQGQNFYQGSMFGYKRSGNGPSYNLQQEFIGALKVHLNDNGNSRKVRLALDLRDDFGVITQKTNQEEDLYPYNNSVGGQVIDGLEIELEDFVFITFGNCDHDNQTDPCEPVQEDGITTILFGKGNDADHYSGIWQHDGNETIDDEFTILTWIERRLEFSTVATYDEDGNPIWFTAQSCTQLGCLTPDDGQYIPRDPSIGSPYKNLYVVNKGAPPLQGEPVGYDVRNHLSYVGYYEREFRNGNNTWDQNDYNKGRVRFDVTDSIEYPPNTNSPDWQRDMNQVYGFGTAIWKTANLHGIDWAGESNNFTAPVGDTITCNPNDVNGTGSCEIKFSWYTNDDFADVKPFYSTNNGQTFQAFEGGTNGFCGEPPAGYIQDAFFCTIDDPATYVFELRKPKYFIQFGDLDDAENWIPIAKSQNKLEVLACNQGSQICEGLADTIPVRADQPLLTAPSQIIHQPGSGPLPGSGGVSGGAANYNIPLAVPVGRNGMAPSLSVNYLSRSGNGILGVGWSLSAGSIINRCAKTYAQDGENIQSDYAVTLENSDRLCLDGQRLMRINATSSDADYWSSGAEYRTEQDGFSKITRVNGSTFKVQTKSGMTRTYEQKTSYDNGNQLNEIYWYLTEEYDSFGNLVQYSYVEKGTNEWLLETITYTGFKNGSNITPGTRTISMDYIDRGIDYNKSYVWGQASVRSKKLNTITTRVGSTVERIYRFSYRDSVANNTLLLSQLEESADNGSTYRTLAKNSWSDTEPYDESLNSWQNMADVYSYEDLETQTDGLLEKGHLINESASVTSDFDGDGIKEHIIFPRSPGSQSDAKILFFNPDNSLKAVIELPSDMDHYTNWVNVAQPGDFNADGYTDFVISRDGQGVEIYSWKNEQVLEKGSYDGTVLNFNTYFEEVGNNLGINYDRLNFNEFDLADRALSKMYFVDFNNDGKQDVLVDRQPLVGQNGGDSGLAKLALYINTTDYSGNTNSANISANVQLGPEQIILEHQPATDWAPEVDVRAILWEKIEAIEDLNGDNIPDIRLKRLVAIGGLPPLDSGLTAVFVPREFQDVVEFMYISGYNVQDQIPLFASDRKSFEELGLKDFNCLPTGSSTSVDCVEDSSSVSLTGGKLDEMDMVNYRLVDVNNDGLKDFLYYNLGYATLQQSANDPQYHKYVFNPNVEKYWKVRLNKGGARGSATLFDDSDIESTIGSVGNAAFITQPGECSDLYAGVIMDADRRYELQRMCHPIFRTGAEFADINGDGVSELLYPDYSENGLVFNHCATPVSTRSSNKSVPTSDDLLFMRQIASSQLKSEGAPSDFTAVANYSLANTVNGTSLDCMVDNCGIEIANRSYKPIAQTGNRGTGVGIQQCSAQYLDNTTGTTYLSYYDLGSNTLSAVRDSGVYKFKAIEFNLLADGSLGLQLIEDTGLYKTLKGSNMGDYNGDGMLDDFAGIGCVSDLAPSCQSTSQYLSENAPDDWSFELNDFTGDGVALMTKNNAAMPNMLTMVLKPKGEYIAEEVLKSEWVSWNYAPISESEDLYTVSERHPQSNESPDGYIDNLNAAGKYFYFYSSMYVVKEMQQSNGTQVIENNGNGTEQIPDFTSNTYKYMDAVYNNEGRGFQGFHKIYVTSKPLVLNDKYTTTSESTFEQIFPLAGNLTDVRVKQGTLNDFINSPEEPHSEESYVWPIPDYNNLIGDTNNLSNYKSYGVVFYPMLEKESSRNELGGQDWKKINTNYGCELLPRYDVFGNLRCERMESKSYAASNDSGSPVLASDDLLSTETITSNYNYSAVLSNGSWWIDRLNTSSIRRQIEYYGDFDESGLGIDTDHQINMTYKWYDGVNDPERQLRCQITQPNGTNLLSDCSDTFPESYDVTLTDFEYDNFGNITKSSKQGRVKIMDGSPQGISSVQHRTTETFYDTQGYFPATVNRGEGNVVLASEDFDYVDATGQVLWSRSANNVYTLNHYDNYDQMIRVEACDSEIIGNNCSQFAPPVYSVMSDCANGICTSAQSHLEDILGEIPTEYKSDIKFNQGYFIGGEKRIPTITYVSQQTQVGAPQITTYYDNKGQAVITKTRHSKAISDHTTDATYQGQESYTLNFVNPLGHQEIASQAYAIHSNGSIVVANDRTSVNQQSTTAEEIRNYPFITLYGYDALNRVDHKKVEVGELNNLTTQGNCTLDTTYTHKGGLTQIQAQYKGNTCANVISNDNLVMARLYDASDRLMWTQGAAAGTDDTVSDKAETYYWYDGSGNPAIIEDADDNQIKTQFDALGRKLQVNDLNMGVKYFEYNGFGEIQTELDAAGYNKHYLLDGLGRVVEQFINTGSNGLPSGSVISYHDTFSYNLKGQLFESLRESNEDRDGNYNTGYLDAHRVNFEYDATRPWMTQRTDIYYNVLTPELSTDNDQVEYRTYYHYDNNYGRLKQINYMNDFGVHSIYGSYGELERQTEVNKNPSSLESSDAELILNMGWNLRGQVTDRRMSNGLIQNSARYYAGTGQMAEQWHSSSFSNNNWNGQLLDYGYDAWGNLITKSMDDQWAGKTAVETLSYDRLHRLIGVTAIHNGQTAPSHTKNYAYDKLGNLIRKNDFNVGNSTYGLFNILPNAITQATLRDNGGTITYEYDAKGNRVKDNINSITQSEYRYDGYNLLVRSVKNGSSNEMYFRYGADNQRYYKRDDFKGETTVYGGKDYERIYDVSGLLLESKFYVTNYLTVTRYRNQSQEKHYMQKDRLGSTTQVLDESGNRVHAKSYDAFGKPRNDDWTDMDTQLFTARLDLSNQNSTNNVDISKRGFTDHEHLDDMQLIHMNGRMYDFNNGRFLSVDPFIQNPYSTQSLNPYTYIFNNPLSGIDPSGYTSECDPEKGNRGDCNKQRNKERRGKTRGFGWQTQFQRVNGITFQEAKTKVNNEIEELEGEISENRIKNGGAINTHDSPKQLKRLRELKDLREMLLRIEELYSLCQIRGCVFDVSDGAISKEEAELHIKRLNAFGIAVSLVWGGSNISTTSKGLSNGRNLKLDLFGGETSQLKGFINVDLRAVQGIRASVDKLPFASNSVSEIVASGPRAKFLNEANRVLMPGGRLYINYTERNVFGKVGSVTELEAMGFKLIQRDGPLLERFSNQTFRMTDGRVMPLQSVRTTILEKIK